MGLRHAFVLLSASGVGCAPAGLDARIRDLRERLATSERSRGDLTRKVEDLDNRLFLLTDQVESQKVEMARRGSPFEGRPPMLPVVTLHPPSDDEDTTTAIGQPVEMEVEPEVPSRPPRELKLDGARDLSPRSARPPRAQRSQQGAAASPTSAEDLPNLGVVKVPGGGARLPVRAPSAGDPIAMYRAAYDKLMAGNPEEAAGDLREFVRRNPRHDYADNAQYWLGESYYARKDFASAAPEFQAVVVRWPSGNKAPDALLKLAYCLLSLDEANKGREVLMQVIEHYPRTDAAHLAQRRLQELPRAEGPK